MSIAPALVPPGSPRPGAAAKSATAAPVRFTSGPLTGAFVAAWVLLAVGEVSGLNRHVGHDAVVEGTFPPGVGVVVFLAGWLVMVGAMTLPSARPAVARPPGNPAAAGRGLQGRFLSGFALVWAGAGVAVLALDTLVHEAVEGIPALGARPSLVGAALLALAGALQLAPPTRRAVAAATAPRAAGPGEAGGAFRAGTGAGARCLRADGPLMLVMFGVGANLAAMALLAGLMAVQRSPRRGRQVVTTVGVLLMACAALVTYDPRWLPSPFGAR